MLTDEIKRQKALFALSDALALLAAFALAVNLHDPSGALKSRLFQSGWLAATGLVATLLTVWLLVFRACDLYRLRNGGPDELLATFKGCTSAWLLTLILGFLAHLDLARITLGLAYVFSLLLVSLSRSGCRALIRRIYTDPKIAIPLVIVGFNHVSQYVCDRIVEQMTQYEFLGFVDDEASSDERYRGYSVLGRLSELERLAGLHPTLEVAIVMPEASPQRLEEIIKLCERLRLRWLVAPWMLQSVTGGFRVDLVGIVPLIGPRGSNIEGLNFAIKRAFDLVAATILLTLSAPIMVVAALAIRLFDGPPILFRQLRLGAYGRPFEMLKFRTMKPAASDQTHRAYVADWIRLNRAAVNGADGSPVFKLANDDRVTRVGRVLRRFSLDELPQLINVLRGDMSLVGPRPALPYELEHYKDWHRRRLEAPPGITGLWQISGRNRLSFEEMVRLDIQYIQEWSLATDLKILMRTVPAMLHGEGF